jgi:glycosyltransferase involved in cell wall biosynthesis
MTPLAEVDPPRPGGPKGAPLISFGIPAYNRPHLLAEALASIAAQTAAVDYEVVVCDDGQTEDNRRVVEQFPAARFSYHGNRPALGPVGNWNECLRRARGRWVMVLHEDDTLYPWYLATVLPRLRADLAAVCTKTVQGAAAPALSAPTGTPGVWSFPPRYFLKSSMTPFPGVLVRRELALHLGGFDERSGPLADYEFWYRLACAGRVEVVRTVGAFYRVGAGQWTERAWAPMIRKTHLLRLRIAREQFPASPRLGRWLARFFTYRNALSYARRFAGRPAPLTRALQLGRIPFARLPSGWVWAALRLFA